LRDVACQAEGEFHQRQLADSSSPT